MSTEYYRLIFVFLALVVCVGSIVGYFVYAMIRMHRVFVERTELQNQSKIIAIENERMLLAADLHDDISPILSAINMKLGLVNPTDEREIKLLNEAIGHIDGLFTRIKELSLKLVPQLLEKRGPLFAIQEFVEKHNNKPELDIKIKPLATPGLSGEKALHVFRMLQEIIHNSAKHGKAKRLRVSAEIREKKLLIRTSEDGIGFKLDPKAKTLGLGLQNLEMRARIVGGKLVTDTGIGRGTRYTIEIPLEKN